MEPFIDRLATALLKEHLHELDQVAVVLPGRRAGLHLRMTLARMSGRTIWSPEMLNMGSLLQRMSGLRQGEGMEMLFLLHEVHAEITGGAAYGLSEFLQWAPVTLRDMSEIDANLIDLDDIYRDLRSFHEIEEWSFKLGATSEGQKRLAQQWRTTGAMHKRMHQLMDDRGAGTSGWLARRVAENADRYIGVLPWKKVWLAGMNALDPASTKVLRSLQKQDRLAVAWDADSHYLDDPIQEAGTFLRRSIKDLGAGVIPPVNEIRDRERKIHLVTVPHAVAQASYAAQIVAGLCEEERSGTGIVLASEDLLLPLLDALPQEAGPYNVTMGIPLAALPVHGLIEAFLELHATHQNGIGFHHAALERLLLHPFVHQHYSTILIEELRTAQRSRITVEMIVSILKERKVSIPEDLELALSPATDVPAIQDRILHLIAWAKRIVLADRFATEQLYRTARSQQRLDRGLERAGQALDIRSYITLRARLLREENIGFYGEALSGTQIMGLLETRALDQKRLVVLGANDGVLPSTGGSQSWIPFELRRAYRLPLQGDREAITAYHFARCMQLANEVYIVYDTSSRNGNGSPSRYVEQWRHELIGRSNTTLIEHAVSAPFNVRHVPKITVKKDELVLTQLKKIGERGFSPSAIATWITCPLDLYFKYVLRVRASGEVDEKLGGDVLGEAVHKVMELIFLPFQGNIINPQRLLDRIPSIDTLLIDHLKEKFPIGSLRSGHFRLRIEMASKAIANHLQAEAARCTDSETVPLHLEADVAGTLPNGMKIRGRCDRIDLRDGIHHILDVKTGSVQPFNVELKALQRDQIDSDKKFALQLLMYSWAFMLQNPQVDRVRAGIIPLQKASQAEGLLLKIEGEHDIRREQVPRITALLNGLIDELLDPTIPFSHTSESLYCGCCVG